MTRTGKRIVQLIVTAFWVLAIVVAYEIGKWIASLI